MAKKAKKAKTTKRTAKKTARSGGRTPRATPLRFAHPFFTTTPVPGRAVSARTSPTSLAQFAADKLGIVPRPTRDPLMELKDIIGQPGTDEIQQAGAIKFHVIGDTGRQGGDNSPQEQVAQAMTGDYDPAAGGHNPALLIHLGDVIYGHDKSKQYRDEFYRPYMKYPGKIIAIPGNHDGESAVKLKAFRDYFCATDQAIPKIAGSIFRQTMNQPGAYWCLDAPFVQIVGLYSNNAENPGAI